MLRSISIALALLIAVPAYAGGSMSSDVRVIVAKPSRAIRALDELQAVRKIARDREFKQQIQEGKDLIKQMKDRDRKFQLYQKDLAKERKWQEKKHKN